MKTEMNNMKKANALHKLAGAVRRRTVERGLCELARWERFTNRLTEEEYTFLYIELAEQVSSNYKGLSPWYFGYLTEPNKHWPLRAQFAHDLALAYEMGVLK